LAAVLGERLLQMGARVLGYPLLLRLNPNTPWKTRGNAALCLRLELPDRLYGEAVEATRRLVEEQAMFSCGNTNPGAVFWVGEPPAEVRDFSRRAVRSLVSKGEAEALLEKHGMESLEYKNGRGIVGALAAVGGIPGVDYTFELLAYRCPEYRGTPRRVDPQSVLEMDNKLSHATFNNVDERGRPLITPHGPDPVLFGVRGETPQAVYAALRLLKIEEPVERWMIAVSNQGTEQHFGAPTPISGLRAYNPAVVEGWVSGEPETIRGGHVFFKVADGGGEVVCAAFEPTGGFRSVVRLLRVGDRVRVFGGVVERLGGLALNLEKLEVLEVAELTRLVKPRCPLCGGSTESMGRGQGLRCRKCGYRDESLKPLPQPVARGLKPGVYLPDKSAHRHLTKPLDRVGREKKEPYSWEGPTPVPAFSCLAEGAR